MKKIFLGLAMLPAPVWRGMGADTDQLRAILDVRLTLDDRNPVGIGLQQKQRKVRKYSTLINTFMFTLLGGMYMLPIAEIPDRVLSLTIYFALLLMVTTFMLITDFSNVLFDARDKYIIFPRPVNDRTIVLSRMLHVFIYLFRVIIPLSLPGWIMLGYMDGWKSATLFILPLLLLLFMVLFLVNGVYLLILRLSKPEKFKDVISYFQIVAAIIFFVSVYFLPRLFDSQHPHDFSLLNYPWVRFTPPYWLASCWTWIGFHGIFAGSALYSALAIVCPLACLFILVKFLSPQFSRRIGGIDTVEGTSYKPAMAGKAVKGNGGRIYIAFANLFNTSDDAKAGFMIAWLQTSRSRSFRMRVYPSFAFVPVYFVYLLTQGHQSFTDSFHQLAYGSKFLLLLYMTSFVMISAMNYVTMSDQYKAAWVYYSAPLALPGKIMLGAFKAIWVKYYFPFFIAIASFVLYVWGIGSLLDIALAFVNVTLFVSCVARVSFRFLPFSMAEQMKQGGARIAKSFLSMLIPAAFGFGHYAAVNVWWLKCIFLALSAILLWLVWDSYANTTWQNVTKGAEEQ
jgi:hypothetical protein